MIAAAEDFMGAQDIDDERLSGEIRKFLKKVGITSQIEIENAVREAAAAGRLAEVASLGARVVLEIPGVGVRHVIEHDLQLR
ncbi:MAG TPA: DUF6494 family protein [Steroidobacteraceae bacterium]|nr:DUF6494 family protein [Steroidobacteraceae bacterium]